MLLIEPFSGMGSVSLFSHSAKPPCSRIGNKTGYAHAISEEIGIEKNTRSILVDCDMAIVAAMNSLLSNSVELALQIESICDGDPLEVWKAAKKESKTCPASWWLWTAGARGGIGGFKGKHKLRPNVDGFIPSRSSLVSRIRSFPEIDAVCVVGDARELEIPKKSIVYLDPPYAETTGYGNSFTREDLLLLVERYREFQPLLIAISEKEPIMVDGARHVNLTKRRRGQTRMSLTKSSNEWLTIIEGSP